MYSPDSWRSANTTWVRNDAISIDTFPFETLSMMSALIHPIANILDSCIFHLKKVKNGYPATEPPITVKLQDVLKPVKTLLPADHLVFGRQQVKQDHCNSWVQAKTNATVFVAITCTYQFTSPLVFLSFASCRCLLTAFVNETALSFLKSAATAWKPVTFTQRSLKTKFIETNWYPSPRMTPSAKNL